MYRQWPFFHSFLSNTQMALFKAKMDIAKAYSRLSVDKQQAATIYNAISEEHQRTTQIITKIANIESLMAETPEIALSLTRRDPYLDPLNYIQIEMIRRYRDENTDEEQREIWQKPLLRTINSIAAGMRNTG